MIEKQVTEEETNKFEFCTSKVHSKLREIINNTSYEELRENYKYIIDDMVKYIESYYSRNNKYKCKTYIKKTLLLMIQEKKTLLSTPPEKRIDLFEKALLENYFNAVEGGETTLYYLKLKNKFGEIRYKIGVTLNDVKTRYKGQEHQFIILYEKKLTHANTIEKKILNEFKHLITDECLLGTYGNEIFKEDVLKLDK